MEYIILYYTIYILWRLCFNHISIPGNTTKLTFWLSKMPFKDILYKKNYRKVHLYNLCPWLSFKGNILCEMPLKQCCLFLDYDVSIWYTGWVTPGLFLSAGTFYEWLPPQLIRWPLHSQSDQGWILIWHCCDQRLCGETI